MNNHMQQAQEASQTHRANLLKSLERRMQAAKSRGDERLIRLLEEERNYYNKI